MCKASLNKHTVFSSNSEFIVLNKIAFLTAKNQQIFLLPKHAFLQSKTHELCMTIVEFAVENAACIFGNQNYFVYQIGCS